MLYAPQTISSLISLALRKAGGGSDHWPDFTVSSLTSEWCMTIGMGTTAPNQAMQPL
jgi:hypothetical protein